MEFTFETQYNRKTMTSMAKALRKTIRKKHSRRSHIFGWIITAVALILMFSGGFTLDMRSVITLAAVLAIVSALLFEDRLNAAVAAKRLLPGTEKAVAVFSEEGFKTTTEIGSTDWNYEKIQIIAETSDFFVFILNASHAQLYDKRSLQGGSAEEFRCFIEKITGKTVQTVK